MVMLDRRKLLAAGGAATLAAPMLMTRAATAQDASQSASIDHAMPPPTSVYKIGDFDMVVVRDGASASDDPGGTFGTDQPKEEVAALLEKNFLPTDKFVNTFSPVLINTGSDVILFDTGLGEGARANGGGRLIEGMTAAGYTREQVTAVVITHMHGDHIGGLMEKGEPAFPNARYITGQTEYDFWTDDARVGTPAEANHKAVMEKVKPLSDQMTFIVDGAEVVSGISAMAAFGHTPGHMIYKVESGGKTLILTADTANHFVLSLQRPDWEVRFDMDKKVAAETRKRVFDMIATDRLAFLGYHMPYPALGYAEKLDTGYRFVPVTYQFEV
ncbi:MBL fold metallo-hydrolase [Rhizobium halophytocola]|uniref:Glyoxylase-like metal-dependent hydrolase (Beta-lactamase superfamily II) n=1 Tax=Rhizobium halophytocola TaxID=735519 RepID=A0ABS4DXU6_9HYPH|nr:MBL fold metallo-hydrolase [Rhizobium halophytocola]MBP1850515.1 glyoxylase-like metal-dependent hydrolase (beta-lactamase superfamily II) [Rhizobium halophytocola]